MNYKIPTNPYDNLKFPNGITIGQTKKNAKKLKGTHTQNLNELAIKYSSGKYSSWDIALNCIQRENSRLHNSVVIDSPNLSDYEAIGNHNPMLTEIGIDGVHPNYFNLEFDRYLKDNNLTSSKDSHDEFIQSHFARLVKYKHEMFFNASCFENFARACEFLALIHATPKINSNPDFFSYELKHMVESYFRQKNKPTYIPHGSLVAAAIYMGFLVEKKGYGAYFNVDEGSIKSLLQEGIKYGASKFFYSS